MQKTSNRAARAATEIKKILSEFLIVRSGVVSKGQIDSAMISITDVELSPCLQHAKVFVVSLDQNVSNQECVEFLERYKPKLRKHLGDSIRMRYIPDLRFFADDSFERAERIERIFSDLKISAASRG